MDTTAANRREDDAHTILRTAADWLRAHGWRRNERNRWEPTEHEFSMYQAALIQKGFDHPPDHEDTYP